jgi:hypothetical protein
MGGSKRSGKQRYNAEVHAKIVTSLRIGAYKVNAAKQARVSIRALEKWLAKGHAGDERYARFALDCDEAMSTFANRLQGTITKAAIAGDWKAAAWDLERRQPALYGRKPEAAVGVTFGGAANGNSGEDEQPRTVVEFYLPDNGRRPVEET